MSVGDKHSFIFSYIAERGNSSQLLHVDNIDIAYELKEISVRFNIYSYFLHNLSNRRKSISLGAAKFYVQLTMLEYNI